MLLYRIKNLEKFLSQENKQRDEGVDVERTVTDWTDIGEKKLLSENSQRLERFG